MIVGQTALEWVHAVVRSELGAIVDRMWRVDHGGRESQAPAAVRARAIEAIFGSLRLRGSEEEAAALRGVGEDPLRAKIREIVEPLAQQVAGRVRPS